MKIQKLIQTISVLTLIATLTSVAGPYIIHQDQKTQAQIGPIGGGGEGGGTILSLSQTKKPIADFAIPDSETINISSRGYQSDSDAEGNLIIVWPYTHMNLDGDGTNCNGLKYEKFNKTGIPSGPITKIAEDCNELPINNNVLKFPDVALNNQGDFVVTWLQTNDSGNYIKSISINSLGTAENILTVSQNPVDDLNGKPSISMNKSSSRDNVNYAITWASCSTNGGCTTTDQDDKIKTQIYNTNFNPLTNPTPVTSVVNSNLDITPTPYVPNFWPSISFGTDKYLITWSGFSDFNNETTEAIWGRTRDIGGFLSDTFQISDSNANASGVQVAGANRIISDPTISNVYYATWTQDGTVPLTKNIYLKKITCDQSAGICSTTSRNHLNTSGLIESLSLSSQVNSSNTNTVVPAISIYQNTNDTSRTPGKESTAIDYLNIAWIKQASTANRQIISQSFDNNLARVGSEQILANLSVNLSTEVPLTMNRDGFYSIIVATQSHFNNALHAYMFRSDYLRIGNETLINSPQSNAQYAPSTSINSNGNYVIAYEDDNLPGGASIEYAVYDKYGTAIKNTTIAVPEVENAIKNSTGGDVFGQYLPSVSYFNEPLDSENYGKFIISWEGKGPGENYGIFYKIFNADGSPENNDPEIAVDSRSEETRHTSSVSAGRYGQFIITYIESSPTNTTSHIKYYYHNGSNIIKGIVENAPAINQYFGENVNVYLNPLADGSNELSEFVINWNDSGQTFLREGKLSSANTTELGDTISTIGYYSSLAGTNLPSLTNIHDVQPGNIARNPFIYAISYADPLSNQVKLDAYTYGGQGKVFNTFNVTLSNVDGINTPANNLHITFDQATGNILLGWANIYNLNSQINPLNSLYLNNDTNTLTNGDLIYGLNSRSLATVKSLSRHTTNTGIIDYLNLTHATGAFNPSEAIFKFTDHYKVANVNYTDTNSATLDLQTTGDGLNFSTSYGIWDMYNGATAIVSNVTGDTLSLTNITPDPAHPTNINPIQNGDPLARTLLFHGSTINPSLNSASLINPGNNGSIDPVFFNVNDSVVTSGNYGSILESDSTHINLNINNVSGFGTGGNDHLAKATIIGYNSNTPYIHDIKGQFLKLSINPINVGQPVSVSLFGPEFTANNYLSFNSNMDNPSISFDSRSSDDTAKVAVFAYSTFSGNTPNGQYNYPDSDGVYQQLFRDPFSLGQRQDLTSDTRQQVSPGGKFIIVPQLIDFGTLAKNQTGTIDLATALLPQETGPGISYNPPYMEVDDLDGTEFNLTVSLTDLTNTTQTTAPPISNSNFIIENDNGTGVTTDYPAFTNLNDVSLDASTAPGQNATLQTTQTLLNKNTNTTGIFKLHPVFKLTIPSNAKAGVHSGVMTFTLT